MDNVLAASTRGRNCVKLADFGAATIVATHASSNLMSTLGTEQYKAPERINCEAYGFNADLWSLGCIVLELVRCKQMEGPVWARGLEIEELRDRYFGDVERRSSSLDDIVQGLLDRDKCKRISIVHLKVLLAELQEQERAKKDTEDTHKREDAQSADVNETSVGAEEEMLFIGIQMENQVLVHQYRLSRSAKHKQSLTGKALQPVALQSLHSSLIIYRP